MKNLPVILMFSGLLVSILSFGQNNGAYDIRIAHYNTDFINMKLYVDVEIKANSPSTEFHLSDQNFRLTIDNSLANPQIDAEFLTGIIDNSFYNAHTLTGSMGEIVSYNIVLAGGDGVFLTSTEYLKIGRLSFDILEANDCYDVAVRSSDPNHFPPTFIGEKLNGLLYEATEGDFYDYLPCGRIKLFVNLEGPYNEQTERMNTYLTLKAPLTQPFNTPPWNYPGTENKYSLTIVDWIMVELREDSSRASVVWQSPATLYSNGEVELRGDQGLPLNHPNPLYLFIDHRNHMPAFLKDTPLTIDGSTISLDLRSTQFNQNNDYPGLKEIKPGTYALRAGDFLKESSVDIMGLDRLLWLDENGLFDGYFQSDTNLDRVVDGLDRIYWNANNGFFSPVEN